MTPSGRSWGQLRPEKGELCGDLLGEARRNLVGSRARCLEQGRPTFERQRVLAPERNPRPPRASSPARRRPGRNASPSAGASDRPSRKVTIVAARPLSRPSATPVARMHRQRADDAVGRQMLHQPEEERQVVLARALLVKGEDERAGSVRSR